MLRSYGYLMGLFTKKKSVPLPVILPSDELALVDSAFRILRSAKDAWQTIQSIPNLVDYCKQTLIPQLTGAAMLGDLDKLLTVLVNDPVLGPTVKEIANNLVPKDHTP